MTKTKTMTMTNLNMESKELGWEELDMIYGGWNPFKWLYDEIIGKIQKRAILIATVGLRELWQEKKTFDAFYAEYQRNPLWKTIVFSSFVDAAIGGIGGSVAYAATDIRWFLKEVYDRI